MKKLSTFSHIAILSSIWSHNAYFEKQKVRYGSAIYVPKKHKKKYKGYHR